jgi:hypothetical protein
MLPLSWQSKWVKADYRGWFLMEAMGFGWDGAIMSRCATDRQDPDQLIKFLYYKQNESEINVF